MRPVTIPTSPYRVADETFLIPTLALDPLAGGYVGAHSLVIRGAEPVVVDTSVSLLRDAWAENVFAVVAPQDVRWIFVSHDDHDHIGNLLYALDICPNATLIASSSIVGRLAGDIELPLERMRWSNDGDSIDAGDRVLSLVRPPMFDSPTTRALYDGSTGVLWAVDSFAAAFPDAVYEASDIPADLYDATFPLLNASNTPWMQWVDRDRYAAHVERSRALAPRVVTSAHGPVLRGAQIDDAYRRTLVLATQPTPPPPGNDVLDQLLAMFAVPSA